MGFSILNGSIVTVNVVKVFHNVTEGTVTLAHPEPTADVDQMISDSAMFYIKLFQRVIFCGGLALFGAINNVINMVVFHHIGTNDSMSVGLMALSMTDFLTSMHIFLSMSFIVWDLVNPDGRIDPLAVDYVTTGWWGDVFLLSSTWVTTFLSIERCVCVVFPFRVKAIFTRSRTIVVVVVIYIVIIAAHMPVFVSQTLGWITVEEKTENGSVVLKDRLVAQFSSNRPQIQFYIDIANGAVLIVPAEALLVMSALWMVYGLYVSSKVRGSAPKHDDAGNQIKKQSNLSIKERRLAKVVLSLASILTICHIPRFVAVYAKQIFPQINFRSSNGNLYSFFWNLALVAATINSSVNIFVYLLVNTTYRQKLKEILGRGKKAP